MAYESKSRQQSADPPPRRNRTEAIGRGAERLGAPVFARVGFLDATLVLRWPEIAGAEVARLCQPIKLSESASGGVLTLKAEPGASLFLQYETRALCERINAWFGRQAVARLRFVQGPLAARDHQAQPSRKPGKLEENEPALDFNGPDTVREALIKLAGRRAQQAPPD